MQIFQIINRLKLLLCQGITQQQVLELRNQLKNISLILLVLLGVGGSDISKYLKPFKVDLFLSANEKDVQDAINEGIAAARILPYENEEDEFSSQVKIAFDGDAVLFSEESEIIYKTQGLEAFIKYE